MLGVTCPTCLLARLHSVEGSEGQTIVTVVGVCRRRPVICNAAGGPASGRVGGRAADTAWRASAVTSR